MGASQNIGFLPSQLGYMLLHKLSINLAIAVIFTLFSSLFDRSMIICPICRGPLAFWEMKICYWPKHWKTSLSKYLLLHIMYEYWLCGCFPLYCTSLWSSHSVWLGENCVKNRKFAAFCRCHCCKLASAAAAKCGIMCVSPPQVSYAIHNNPNTFSGRC